jgi:hypothetical protein
VFIRKAPSAASANHSAYVLFRLRWATTTSTQPIDTLILPFTK